MEGRIVFDNGLEWSVLVQSGGPSLAQAWARPREEGTLFLPSGEPLAPRLLRVYRAETGEHLAEGFAARGQRALVHRRGGKVVVEVVD